jgi:PAS domain-containing protein
MALWLDPHASGKPPLKTNAFPFQKDGWNSMPDLPEEGPLRLILQQMPGLYWTTHQNLRITSNWGKRLAASNIPPDALVGRSVCEFLGCADRHTTPIAEHGEALRGSSSHLECNWKNRVWEIFIEPLRAASGEINGCLGSGMDVTDRKKNEEQTLYHPPARRLDGIGELPGIHGQAGTGSASRRAQSSLLHCSAAGPRWAQTNQRSPRALGGKPRSAAS